MKPTAPAVSTSLSTAKITLFIASNLALAGISHAAILSFGLGGPQGIPGSGGITYTTTTIEGGTATPGTHNGTGSTGTGANIGSNTNPYTGTFFSPSVDGNNTLVTSINSDTRRNIDNNIAADYANYIGLCVSFSAPIPMYSFGFIDVDGESPIQNEWGASFAYNSATSSTIAPGISTAVGSTIMTRPSTTTVNWAGLTGAPTMSEIAYQSNSAAPTALDAHDPNAQIEYNYGGQLVTDLYFLWGLEGNAGGTSNNNSGLTGFTVIEPADAIPEPSRTVFLGFGLAGLLLRRKRSAC